MKRYFLVGAPLLLVVGAIAFVLFRSEFSTRTNQNGNSSTLIRYATTTYTSRALGVRFHYASVQNGKGVRVEENGNTISVHFDDQSVAEGQSVQVWTKPASTTLEQAVTQQFLAGYDPTKCFVGPPLKAPTHGVGAIITVAQAQSATGPWWEGAENCPAGYTATTSLRYFWTPTQTATAFVFFAVEEPFIAGPDSGTSWAETLELL